MYSGEYDACDRVAQLAEHWASIPKVVGSIPTVVRHIFQACPVWIYTQSNIYHSSARTGRHPNANFSKLHEILSDHVYLSH